MLRDGKGACCVMAVVIFHTRATFVREGISFSPLGETGEGFYRRILPCPSRTSLQVKRSPKKNFNATPSAFGTSPKYDKKKSECGFKIYIVVFGGGRVRGDFRNDEVVKNLSAVVGNVRGLVAL